MNIHVSKNGPFAFRLSPSVSSSPFLSLLSFPLLSSLSLLVPLSPLLSFFNVHPAKPANALKTKDLKKRHFRLKFLSQGKPLRLKALGAKFAQSFAHLPADPTLHKPPETDPTCSAANPASCKVSCRICRPNPTYLTPLIIKL